MQLKSILHLSPTASDCKLETNRKHCRLGKVLSLFQNISVTRLGQKMEGKQFECGEFVAWTPDTTEILHAFYWASSVGIAQASCLNYVAWWTLHYYYYKCAVFTRSAMRLQSLCATWKTLVQGRTSGWLSELSEKGQDDSPLLIVRLARR